MSTAIAAVSLLGLELDGGWTVTEEVRNHPGKTGGHFSRCYRVIHDSGREGFLKAINFEQAAGSPDPAAFLQAMIDAFLFERDLLLRCRDRGMSKVIRPLGDGVVNPSGVGIGVQYLIFEKADSDARDQLNAMDKLDDAWALRTIHQMAVALRQLHGADIAHQDLKPSNVLHFDTGESKIGDLGRASAKGVAAPHDDFPCAGDCGYGPPELLYDSVDPDWRRRRVACDLYLLGSLVFSFYLGTSATSAILARMHPSHDWKTWGDGYQAVLPFVRAAFDQAVSELQARIPRRLRQPLVTLTRYLCDPDPSQRGHPLDRAGFGQSLSLTRFISKFDLLAWRAERGLLE